MIQTNYLVIGSGVAGLTFAIKIATHFPDKKVTIITKSNESESNTKYAQGGIAVVMNKIKDNFQKHIEDTLICGDGLCDKKVVELVVYEGPKRIKELMDWGTNFDKNSDGNLNLGKEGGHSENRVVHHKDQTGFEIERAILYKAHLLKNIEIFDFHFALDLITKKSSCIGATVLNEKTKELITFQADYTLLATGGIGQVYGHTTNPEIATGDGIAMAKRANASIKDMEFIQFHPTALFSQDLSTTFLISEAVRGFGAYLRNKEGNRFMLQYDKRGELASRDIVSQSIEKELKISGNECVYLDCTHIDMTEFKQHFPMIYERCKEFGIQVEKDWIPVIPAQHYLCGGIEVDLNGKSSIENLFACGECSYTGLHGANRLASNSLLEALVFSDRIFTYLKGEKTIQTVAITTPNNENKGNNDAKFISKTRIKLQVLMQKNAGIIRNNESLQHSEIQLLKWKKAIEAIENNQLITKEYYELKNLIETSLLIINYSLNRTENKGGFIKV
ncbi:L-aspartate oxidase [uncultured Flavobacterium sp.]|uniref:L-aspartate oxidase n=1 Tax=uncultured Flavobacterium sp. TaxID=165435 RepID=UPI0030C8B3FB